LNQHVAGALQGVAQRPVGRRFLLKRKIRRVMTVVWRIVATTEHTGSGPPLKEYFLAAIADQAKAIEALRSRRNLSDTHQHMRIVGEADPEFLDWLEVKDGEIFCVTAVS
jgi:hypothetical protein